MARKKFSKKNFREIINSSKKKINPINLYRINSSINFHQGKLIKFYNSNPEARKKIEDENS